MKIISLVPSLTELLFDLGLEDDIIGRTKFCIHPHGKVFAVAKYGGTKNPHVESIIAARPDLVIANKEENRKEDIEPIIDAGITVLVTDINDYNEALEALLDIGAATNTLAKAKTIKSQIEHNFSALRPIQNKIKTTYLIWKDPYMTIGNDTFIDDMMFKCGFENAFGSQTRYPSTTLEEIKSVGTELILLSSEPYPFKESHIKEIEQLTGIKAILVDGEYFSWYGSRMLGAVAYFNSILRGVYY